MGIGADRFESGDLGSAQGGQRWAHRTGPGLRVHLPVGFGDFAVETSVHERISRGGVVVVAQCRGGMAVERVEPGRRRAVRLREAEEGVAVEGVADRQGGPEHGLQVQRCGVVVVVIGPTAMAAPLV